ncbi:carbohydrate ABC transporter permease [Roseinatronobacter monicus]|uniref:Multiple sugar transport system permease protein n=1 Tax=Roseinatronobacter monicus TaxID=393481 RepID=A0A543K5V8_9RHOB|nr:sugar ABC transporter permease [Roseinatronobacter monicus]TQM90466.1 multiple sugar transport system permease protein [Roseinatronobacter monicus]
MSKSGKGWYNRDWVTPAEARWGLILVLPVMALFLALKIAPLLYGGYLSLTQYSLLQPPRFIGLANYERLFNDPRAMQAFRVTLYYTVGTVVPATILSLAIAVMLDTKLRGMAVFRTVFYMPQVASWVAIGVAWLYIMNPAFGPFNYLLSLVGIERQGFLADGYQALPTLIGIGIWRQMGYSVVIFLAGLQGIPQHLREAAIMDGASAWRSFRHVTLPILMPTTMFVVVTAVIFNLQVFDQVVVLTGGGPGRATTTAVLFSYNQAFQSFAMGYAAAVAVVLFLAIMGLSIVLLLLSGQLRAKKR